MCFQLNLKEYVMNEAPELEVVDLGDAKEVTMGVISPVNTEENPVISMRE